MLSRQLQAILFLTERVIELTLNQAGFSPLRRTRGCFSRTS